MTANTAASTMAPTTQLTLVLVSDAMATTNPIRVGTVRQLASEPTTRGIALCWLVDHGLEDARALPV